MELPSVALLLFLAPVAWGSFVRDLTEGKDLNPQIEKSTRNLVPNPETAEEEGRSLEESEADRSLKSFFLSRKGGGGLHFPSFQPSKLAAKLRSAAETVAPALAALPGSSFNLKSLLNSLHPYMKILVDEVELEMSAIGKTFKSTQKGIMNNLQNFKQGVANKKEWYKNQVEDIKRTLFRIVVKYVLHQST